MIVENKDQAREMATHLQALKKSKGWEIITERLEEVMADLQKRINTVDPDKTQLKDLSEKIAREKYQELLDLPDLICTELNPVDPLTGKGEDEFDPYE